MKIKNVAIKNFRGYSDEINSDFEDLTAFVGKNDIGKSTILEALDIFFNDGKGVTKLDKADLNVESKARQETDISIRVCFTDLPEKIVIDTTNETSLSAEYLLNSDGLLEVVKRYPNAGTPKVFICAMHPTNPECADLLTKKDSDLRKIIETRDIPCEDKTRNNTIIKYHANISKALNDAVRLEKIPMTPLKRGMRPKQVEHIGKFYTLSEVEHLLSCVKGDGTEFPVLMAAFYGLRRSEIMGLKWDSIDFDANTITIAHVVVEVSIDGKDTIVAKDRPKNKKSYRTLPLVPEYRRLLLQMKKHQEEYRELCGNCYHESDYIYVNDLGEPIRPNYVSQHFKLVLKNNNLREITFHELRHTCASLLLKSGISMKDIQAWLGHSNYNTTANIYAHLESSSKEITGNAMQDNFTISANLAAREAVQE